MRIGYARVSCPDQNLDSQIDTLKAAGCERVFSDKLTGGNTARPGLQEALAFCRTGDALVVCRLDRLARSLQDLLATIGTSRARCRFRVAFRRRRRQRRSRPPDLSGLWCVAEFERALIRERTQAGLAAARSRGRKAEAAQGRRRQARHAAELGEGPKQPTRADPKVLGISKARSIATWSLRQRAHSELVQALAGMPLAIDGPYLEWLVARMMANGAPSRYSLPELG